MQRLTQEDRVLIAGAGPVGLVAAANLVRSGMPVTVFEAGPTLSEESRASTFHPPTLDMLHALGAAEPLIAQGLVAPKFQYRTRQHGLLAEFDFGCSPISPGIPTGCNASSPSSRASCTSRLRGQPNFALEFDSRGAGGGAARGWRGSHNRAQRPARDASGRWLIGADGASSDVRRSLGIEFEGFTWPERFLVVSTPFDFRSVIPDLAAVSYVADPERWHFLLQIPGLWRVMFPISPGESDELALSREFAQSLMASVLPGKSDYEIAHVTLYKVHQRVAKTFRAGRAFLVGDAAHINNPLGGMGMNGGIHDAINLTERLAAVWRGDIPESELDRYDLQRRLVTLEYIQTQTIQNKRNLESAGAEFRQSLEHISADRDRTRDYLMRVSMIASLRRAEELG